jgi:hypothetical protein
MGKRILLLILLPLLIGALFYIFFRTGSWFSDFFPKYLKVNISNEAFKYVTGIAPDFCWSFSIGSFLYSHRDYSNKSWFHFFVLFILIFSELIQMWMPKYFLFDVFDLLAALAAWFLSFKLRKLFYEK